MINSIVNICGVELQNPVITASGTFSRETAGLTDVNKLGAVTVKGVSITPWAGNKPPRVAETYGGMLNAVGLQNPGVHAFIEEIPFWRQFKAKLIVNVCGHTIEEYCECVDVLAGADVDLLELNISCPNVSEGGISFGTDPATVETVVAAVKKHARQPLIVKLSPNVTDITAIARAARDGGADALSLINTLLGMRIDLKTKKPVLANTFGGLSGPAIKPVALRMVYQVARAVNLPIIGMGGIMTSDDALEFLYAGATAVSVGTAHFVNPTASADIADELVKRI